MRKIKLRLNQFAQNIGVSQLNGVIGIKAFNYHLDQKLSDETKAAIRSDALHLTKLGENNPLSNFVLYLNSIGIFPYSPEKTKTSLDLEKERKFDTLNCDLNDLKLAKKETKDKAGKALIDEKMDALKLKKKELAAQYKVLQDAQYKERKAQELEVMAAKKANTAAFNESLKGLTKEEQTTKKNQKAQADAASVLHSYRHLEGFKSCELKLLAIISSLFDLSISVDQITTMISGGSNGGAVLDWLTSRVKDLTDMGDDQIKAMFRAPNLSKEECEKIRSLSSLIKTPQWIASENFSRDTRILMGANASWFSNLVNGLEDFKKMGPITTDFSKVPDSILTELGFKRDSIVQMSDHAQSLANEAISASEQLLLGRGGEGTFATIELFQDYFDKHYSPMLGLIIGRLKNHRLIKEVPIKIPSTPKRLAKQPLTKDHAKLAHEAQLAYDAQLELINDLDLNKEVRLSDDKEFHQFARTIRSTLFGNDISIAIAMLKRAHVCKNNADLHKFFKGSHIDKEGKLIYSNDRSGYGYFWTGEKNPRFIAYGVNTDKLKDFDPIAFVDYFLEQAKNTQKIALVSDLIRWKININAKLIDDGNERSQLSEQGTILQAHARNTNPKTQWQASQVPFEPANVYYAIAPKSKASASPHQVQHRNLIANDLLFVDNNKVNLEKTFEAASAFAFTANEEVRSKIVKELVNLPHELWVSLRVKEGGQTRPEYSYAFGSKGEAIKSACHQWFRITGEAHRKRPIYQVAFGKGAAKGVRATLLENGLESRLKLTIPFEIEEARSNISLPNLIFFDLNMYGLFYRVEDGQGRFITDGFEACNIPHVLNKNEQQWRKQKQKRARHEFLKTSKERERATMSGQYIGLIWKLIEKHRAAPVFENNIGGMESGGNRMRAIWDTIITSFVLGDIEAERSRLYNNLNVANIGAWDRSLIHPNIVWKSNPKNRAFKGLGTTVKGAYTSITCPCCERAVSLDIRGAKKITALGNEVEIINSDGEVLRYNGGKHFDNKTDLSIDDAKGLFLRRRMRGPRSNKKEGDSNHSAFYCFNLDCGDYKKEQHADKNATLNIAKNFWKMNEYRK